VTVAERAEKRASRWSGPRGVVIIALGGALVAGMIGVRGEFPLSDDASFAYTTRTLCTTGSVQFLPWTAASLVLQAAYGAALCRMFGFSFTVLRASTVVLAVVGVVAFFSLLRRLDVAGPSCALVTALFALNPLYVNLAFTFMTDVPFTVLVVGAAYGYVRGLNERRDSFLAWGSVAAAAALLVRQQGILVAVAAALAAATTRTSSAPERRRAAAIAVLVPAATFLAFHVWIVSIGAVPIGYASRLGQLRDLSVASVLNCGFRGLCYLGLFAVPLTAALAGALERSHRRRVVGWCTALAVLAIALFARERALMFYLTNVLYDFGLGALTLRDTLFLGYDPPVHLGRSFAMPLTVVTIIATGLLAAAWTTRPRERAPGLSFLRFSALLFFATTLLQSRYYLDRHVLIVVPFVLAATLTVRPLRSVPRLATALLIATAWYSIAGTHDYLAWNRARFAGLDTLLADGVSPAMIDGGVEFNAWYVAPTLGTWPSDRDVRVGQPESVRSWWWVVDDRFIASFRPLTGYHVKLSVPFSRWLVPGTGHVLILERSV